MSFKLSAADLAIQQSFLALRKQVDELRFSTESIVELGALRLEAERKAKSIKNRAYKALCIKEIKEIDGDELEEMYSDLDKESFDRARHEFSCILGDCHRGRV